MRSTTAYLVVLVLHSAAGADRMRTATGYMYSYYVAPTSGTPWRPAWSPDGHSIVFSMSGSIWKIQSGETAAYELTANRTYDSSPACSPDGRWIAYTAEDSEGVNLMLLNAATGESTALTRGANLNLDPAWSPDGHQLAFVRNQPRGQFHIYLLSIQDGRAGEPAQLTSEHDFGRARLYFGRYDDHIQPSWSPDGKELMLVSNRGIPLGSGAIWRAPVEPDAMGRARQILREETLYRTEPQWSPDGKRILYSSHRGSQYNNLYLLPAEGGEPYQLTFGNWDHFDPRWSPDGQWIVYVSNQHGLSDLRLLRTFGGEERTIKIRRRVYRRPMGRLEVQLKDGVAARIYLKASDGKTYAPPDAYQRIAGRADRRDFFHARAHFTVDVPPGPLTVEAAKGIEYTPVVKSIDMKPGSFDTITLELRRAAHLAAAGWYSGSDHVHMNYGGNLHNTPENMMFIADAEDLDVIGEKVANKDNRVFDHQYFTGRPHRLSSAERLLVFGEEYRPPFYGHINLINLTRHLLSPYITGYEGTAVDSLYPSNTDMLRLAGEQGAIGGYVHPWSREPSEASYAVARGFPVDLALGTVAYLEILTSAGHFTHTAEIWHRALNCGFRLTASAGEDSILNMHATPILGSSRIYAYLGPKLTWDLWVDAIRRGRTFVTNGPLLDFTVNGEIPGAEIHLPPSGGAVEVNASFTSIVPAEKMELFFNGTVLESAAAGGSGQLHKRITIPRSGWLTLRVTGKGPTHPIDDSYLAAETSPVYVYCGGQHIRSAEDAGYFIRWIDDIARQASAHAGWRSEQERRHVLDQFAEARKIFELRQGPRP